jgi:RNA polymerase sigma-70 factor (ECF subfamily)
MDEVLDVGRCAREHGATLGRLCMALLGSQADAEEAVQETLIAAHRGAAGWRREGTVKAWLCGIARHVCARMLEGRRRRNEKEKGGGMEVVPEGAEDPRSAFAVKQRAKAVRAALEKLRPSEREALVLRYVAGLSHREIGEACQVDEATARKRVSRGLESMRSEIGEIGDVGEVKL